jgi:multiple sugar transport system ATP-binding protein
MARVVLKNVGKKYGDVVAVKDVDVVCEDKEFLILVGPSGCGKTTTLRMVAGLEEITSGEIFIDDKFVNDVPPKDRDIAMVFQNYALDPHMTVYENMAFGLKLRKYPKSEIKQRVDEAAEILSIEHLLQRKPKQLSGGERQRVAVGRAIVRKPKVFLFDEPLSNLDAKLRVQMRAELSKLHTRLQATMMYVTHDQVEAMTMGEKIVVMKNAIVHQIADPRSLYDKPVNKFVAGFIGSPSMNFIDGILEEKKGGLYFNEENFEVKLPDDMIEKLKGKVGEEIVMGIRPEDIYDKVYAPNASADNTLTATVEVVENLGAESLLYLTTGKTPFIAKMDSDTEIEINQEVELVFDMNKIHFFDMQTEEAIR